MEAMEQRKERVLQLGEKAGTKLLFPMMLLFGIVMAIVIKIRAIAMPAITSTNKNFMVSSEESFLFPDFLIST